MNPQFEKIYYHYLDKCPELTPNVELRFYDNVDVRLAHKIREEFRKKYNKSPSKVQLKEIVKLKNLQETLDFDRIDALYEVDLSQYEPEWLQKTVEGWIKFKIWDSSIIDLVNYAKTCKPTLENLDEIIQTSKNLMSERNNVDFNFDDGSDFYDPETHQQKIHERFSTGYAFFDKILSGGWAKKSLVCFAGAPKSGKSILLSNLCAQAVRNGHNCAYISLEMSEALVMGRLGQNMFNVKGTDYSTAADNPEWVKSKLKQLYGLDAFSTPGALRVKEFPTSSASTVDLENWLKRSEEINGHKYQVVFVDYISILKNWRNPNTENLYIKIKQIAEDLRAIASRMDICIVTAIQLNKAAFNVTDLGMGDVAESSGLVHTVDALFGIIQDEIMYANNEYYYKVLANRVNGMKNAKKKFNISYDYMRLSEDANSEIIETDF